MDFKVTHGDSWTHPVAYTLTDPEGNTLSAEGIELVFRVKLSLAIEESLVEVVASGFSDGTFSSITVSDTRPLPLSSLHCELVYRAAGFEKTVDTGKFKLVTEAVESSVSSGNITFHNNTTPVQLVALPDTQAAGNYAASAKASEDNVVNLHAEVTGLGTTFAEHLSTVESARDTTVSAKQTVVQAEEVVTAAASQVAEDKVSVEGAAARVSEDSRQVSSDAAFTRDKANSVNTAVENFNLTASSALSELSEVAEGQQEAIITRSTQQQELIASAGQEQVDQIASSGNTQRERIVAATTEGISGISDAGALQLNRIADQGESQIAHVRQEGTTQVSYSKAHADRSQEHRGYVEGIANKFGSIDQAVSQATTQAEKSTAEAERSTQNNTEAANHNNEAKAARDDAVAVVYEGGASVEPSPGKLPVGNAEGVIDPKWIKKVCIPKPDFQMELTENILIQRGKGSPVMMDVSEAGDGSVMRAVPNMYQGDFTRASEATYQDRVTGELKVAAINEPRFEKEGILIEGSSTNKFMQSEYLQHSNYWHTTNCTITETADSITSLKVLKLERSGDWNVSGYINIRTSSTSEEGKWYTVSCLVKASEESADVMLRIQTDYPKRIEYNFDLHNGEVGRVSANGFSDHKAGVRRLGNSWYRITVTGLCDHTSGGAMYSVVSPTRKGGTEGSSDKPYNMLLCAPQLEELPFASSYIPTNGSPVTRVADKFQFDPKSMVDFTSESTIAVSYDASFLGENDSQKVWFSRTTLNISQLSSITASGNNQLNVRPSQSTTIGMNTQFADGGHVVNTFDGERVAGYMNGVLVLPSTPYSEDGLRPYSVYLGCSDSAGNGLFGRIKNFRIWNKALTEEQIYFLKDC